MRFRTLTHDFRKLARDSGVLYPEGRSTMKKLGSSLVSLFFALIICPAVFGQASPERLQAIGARLAQIKAFGERMPASKRKVLSSGALNLLQLADKFDNELRGLNRLQADSSIASEQPDLSAPSQAADGVARVSNPRKTSSQCSPDSRKAKPTLPGAGTTSWSALTTLGVLLRAWSQRWAD